MAARVDLLSTKKNRGPYLALHHRLHSRIGEGARCDALSAVIEQTCALSSTWFCLLPRPEAPRTSTRHRDLAKALVTSTPEAAAGVMREHVRFSQREALERLKPYFRMRKAHGRTFFRSERAQARHMKRGSYAEA
jgi:DNA-binding GntR family transcriptional regulator